MEAKQETPQNEVEALLRQWFYVGQKINTAWADSVLVGFGKKYVQRGGFDHKRAGVHIDFEKLVVSTTSGHCELLEANMFLGQLGRGGEFHERIKKLSIRIGDLPDTPFWVGDVVHHSDTSIRGSYTIEGVHYVDVSNAEERRYFLSGNGMNQTGKCLVLVERGNIWKLEHGEPLVFPGSSEQEMLYEEAEFYKSLGMSQKVIFTDTESELWPFGGGIRELQQGRADRLIVKDKKTQEVILIKYDRAEFGNRMRVAELARLGC
ncbi:MAG TPA: hypothetical protein VJJ02_03545 [Candidatus Paceibacterota bacterium]